MALPLCVFSDRHDGVGSQDHACHACVERGRRVPALGLGETSRVILGRFRRVWGLVHRVPQDLRFETQAAQQLEPPR